MRDQTAQCTLTFKSVNLLLLFEPLNLTEVAAVGLFMAESEKFSVPRICISSATKLLFHISKSAHKPVAASTSHLNVGPISNARHKTEPNRCWCVMIVAQTVNLQAAFLPFWFYCSSAL